LVEPAGTSTTTRRQTRNECDNGTSLALMDRKNKGRWKRSARATPRRKRGKKPTTSITTFRKPFKRGVALESKGASKNLEMQEYNAQTPRRAKGVRS